MLAAQKEVQLKEGLYSQNKLVPTVVRFTASKMKTKSELEYRGHPEINTVSNVDMVTKSTEMTK